MAASTDAVSISRSNVSSAIAFVATPDEPGTGLIAATTGGPTVRKANGPAGSGATLPARSLNPAATDTLNWVSDGSLRPGVKIATVSRSQVNVPPTWGSIWKRRSTEALSTGSLNARSIAARVWAT